MTQAVFIILAIFTLMCALGVVFCKNAVYSSFSLVLCFFGLSAVYVMWGATFIAMIQVLVYTGAIVVLFVFVVMLLDLVRSSPSGGASWWMVAGSGACAWFFSLLLLRTLNRAGLFQGRPSSDLASLRSIAKLLFTDYLWPFEVLSVFLLALIIAVYVLTRPEHATADKGEL